MISIRFSPSIRRVSSAPAVIQKSWLEFEVMTASFSVSAGGLSLSGSAEGCMTNCRPTSGIVPVMVPLKGVPVVVGAVWSVPTLYTHVPFRYARLMYQSNFWVSPGRVARSSAPGGSACARAAVGRVAISVATLISKANIRLAGRWMSCNDVLMFYVYNRVYKSVCFPFARGRDTTVGLSPYGGKAISCLDRRLSGRLTGGCQQS